MRNSVVIGVTGPARAGKNTVARLLLGFAEMDDTYGSAFELSMAGPLKHLVRELLEYMPLQYDPEYYVSDAHKDEIIPEIGVSPRVMLQTLGTDWGRKMINEDLWLETMLGRIEQVENLLPISESTDPADAEWDNPPLIVIPDVRFDNEAAMCDYVIEVTRPQKTGVPKHASEKGVAKKHVDFRIHNSGTRDKLRLTTHKVYADIRERYKDATK
jgi:hypothetical protein